MKDVCRLEHDEWTGQCFCLLSFDQQSDRILSDRPCAEWKPSNDALTQPVRTLYRTGYVDFGNHLEKNREKANNTQLTIVFFLTVGGRGNLRQIKRLVRAIYSRQHYYLIHVDSVSDPLLVPSLAGRVADFRARTAWKLSASTAGQALRTRSQYSTDEQTLLNHLGSIELADRSFGSIQRDLRRVEMEFLLHSQPERKWLSLEVGSSRFDWRRPPLLRVLRPVQVFTNFLSMYTSYNFLRTHNREPFKYVDRTMRSSFEIVFSSKVHQVARDVSHFRALRWLHVPHWSETIDTK